MENNQQLKGNKIISSLTDMVRPKVTDNVYILNVC